MSFGQISIMHSMGFLTNMGLQVESYVECVQLLGCQSRRQINSSIYVCLGSLHILCFICVHCGFCIANSFSVRIRMRTVILFNFYQKTMVGKDSSVVPVHLILLKLWDGQELLNLEDSALQNTTWQEIYLMCL